MVEIIVCQKFSLSLNLACKYYANKLTLSKMSNETQPHLSPGYHSVMPGLTFKDTVKAMKFYERAFDAEEVCRIPGPNDRTMHAEIRIGDCIIMLSDEFPEMEAKSPDAYGGTPMLLRINTTDVDSLFARAIEAGAEVMEPVKNRFWGQRVGFLKDPFGYRWSICTYIEEVSPEEIMRRARQLTSFTEVD